MKKLLTFAMLLFCLSASAQHSYISSSGDVILEAGSIEVYDSPYIYVDFTHRGIQDAWVATLQLTPTLVLSPTAGANSIKTYQIEFDIATIDALTCSGSTNSEDIKNCLLQAIEDYLIVLNGSIFTLH